MLSSCAVSCADDEEDECYDWALSGECDKNPGYMWENCEKSCLVKCSGHPASRKQD